MIRCAQDDTCKTSLEPDCPDGIDAGVGDGGGGNATIFAPGAAVENSGDGGEDDVMPIEMRASY